MTYFKVRRTKEEFNELVLSAKREKFELVAQLEDISQNIIETQVCGVINLYCKSILIHCFIQKLKLEAGKRKPVPSVPELYPEELDKDPFQVKGLLNAFISIL